MNISSIPILSFNNKDTKPPQSGHAINVNIFSPEATLSYIRDKVRNKEGFAIATVNLDHIVKLSSDKAFFEAYTEHDVVVADGFPIVWLGRLMGKNVVRTTGADLVEPVMRLLEKEDKGLALIGTTQTVLEDVSSVVKKRFPKLNIVFMDSPPFGFNPLSDTALALMRRVEASGASVCFLAFGAPKQEILAAQAKKVAPHVGFLSIGAALDFIAGSQIRAPLWVRQTNIEWFWRLVHDPRRLFWRYAQCAFVLPILLVRAVYDRFFQKQTPTK